MISIMKSLHKYVPTTCTEQEVTLSTGQKDVAENYKFHQIQFGGDQLTCARVRGSQTAKFSEENDKHRLLGLVGVVEDWHAKVCLLEVRLQTCYIFTPIIGMS